MFKFFKNDFELIAPVTGNTMGLKDVPDSVFAQKLAGDGMAIDAESDTVVAPASGKLTLVFRTNHAFGITLDNGIELLVHIGLDTVHLQGKGFQRLKEQGVSVNAGDEIIRVDRDVIKKAGYKLIVPVLITNMDIVKSLKCTKCEHVTAGKDVVATYKVI